MRRPWVWLLAALLLFSGGAHAQTTATAADRWEAEYWNNSDQVGQPALVRLESTVQYDWGAGSPAADRIAPDTFSARWTRTLDLTGGQYRFTVAADDGIRLWIDGALLIDQWHDQPLTTYSREIMLDAGPTPVRVDYYENGGLAAVSLSWARLHGLPGPAPGLIVDNAATGFVRGGPAADWSTSEEGYAGSLAWTRSSADSTPPYNWGRWFPDLDPGAYEVSVFIPQRFTTTAQARYWISHSEGYTLRVVDQSANGNRWVTLGTFVFDGRGSDFVSLADVTYEREARLVAYDAVRWTPVTETGNASAAVTPAAGPLGTRVTVDGRGFPPGETVSLRLGRPNTEPFGRYGSAIAAADGTVSFTLTLPTVDPAGTPLNDVTELVFLLISSDGTSATASFSLR